MVEHGHELAEEIMLGPVHRYDLPHSYVPNYRFSSRHELVNHSHDDETGTRIVEPATPRLRRPRTTGRSSEVRVQRVREPGRPKPERVGRPSSARTPKAAKKAARARRVAAALGITVEQLTDLRRWHTSASVGTAGMGTTERQQLVAARMGAPVSLVERYEAAERGIGARHAAKEPRGARNRNGASLSRTAAERRSPPRTRGAEKRRGHERRSTAIPSKPSPPSTSALARERVRPPRNLLCESCGVAINREGWCRCS
jgi:hypothetical protein